jgi:hypothetical protein
MPVNKVDSGYTLQKDAIVAGNGDAITIDELEAITIEIIGTNVASSTIVFEAQGPSGAWYNMPGVRLNDVANTIALQTTAVNELWQIIGLRGLAFRARISSITGTNAKITVLGVVY